MNVFSQLSRGALILAGAFLAIGCSNLAASGNGNVAPTVTPAPAAPVAAASPVQDLTPRISVEEAKKLVDAKKAVLVDVRGPEAYKASHIKGALEHSIGKLEAGDFKGLPKDKRIIAYCSCSAEQTSSRAASVLNNSGFKDVVALVGGTTAWQTAGYEMVQASGSPAPAH